MRRHPLRAVLDGFLVLALLIGVSICTLSGIGDAWSSRAHHSPIAHDDADHDGPMDADHHGVKDDHCCTSFTQQLASVLRESRVLAERPIDHGVALAELSAMAQPRLPLAIRRAGLRVSAIYPSRSSPPASLRAPPTPPVG
jgi:hypothetical protein